MTTQFFGLARGSTLVALIAGLSGVAHAQVTATPAVVSAYIAAESTANDLFSFCKATRPFVAPVEDYPECPPHEDTFVVIPGATTVRCGTGHLGVVTCMVQYKVLGRYSQFNLDNPFIKGKKTVTERLPLKEVRGKLVIDAPYLPPKLGAPQVMEALKVEQARIGPRADKTYSQALTRAISQLEAANRGSLQVSESTTHPAGR